MSGQENELTNKVTYGGVLAHCLKMKRVADIRTFLRVEIAHAKVRKTKAKNLQKTFPVKDSSYKHKQLKLIPAKPGGRHHIGACCAIKMQRGKLTNQQPRK